MSWSHLSWGAMVEVVVGVVMFAAAVWLYRRPVGPTPDAVDDARGYGSQGAVILLIIAAILLIHGLGGLEYHPSEGEIEMMKAQAR